VYNVRPVALQYLLILRYHHKYHNALALQPVGDLSDLQITHCIAVYCIVSTWYSVQCKTSRTTISTNTKIPSQIPQRSCFAACWRPECPANHTLHCSVLYCVNSFGECLVQMFQFHPFNIAIPGGTKSILGPILSSTYGTSSSTY